jgi:superfamily II DNA or RNA helicase
MEVIFKFKAKYIYGLTATPYRADGLQSLMFATLGPVLFTVTRDELYDANYLIRPKIVPIYTLFKYSQASHVEDGSVDAGGEDFNYQAILTQLYADDIRTDLVLMNILELSKNTFNYQIVLINNKEYITKIYNRLLELTKDSTEYVNVRPVIFTSDIKGRNARANLLQALLDKKFNIVFATQLAIEGLDLPHVNILHLVSPRNGDIWNKEKEFTGTGLEQEVGRIQRPAPGKNENNTIVFDYVDHNTGVFNTQFIRRRAVYKRLGLTVPRKPKLEEDANVADFIKSIKF